MNSRSLVSVVDVQHEKRESARVSEAHRLLQTTLRRYAIHLLQQGRALLWFEISIMNSRSLVSVVDDDESVRESLPDLLQEFGFAPRTFSSAEEFLASDALSQTKCLLLDIAMPGMSGPELQQELKLRKIRMPIIFITAQRDETVRPRLIGQGAIECLTKPFSDTALLEALNSVLQAK